MVSPQMVLSVNNPVTSYSTVLLNPIRERASVLLNQLLLELYSKGFTFEATWDLKNREEEKEDVPSLLYFPNVESLWYS